MRDLLDALISYAPPPLSRKAATRTIEATEPAMTGIIFKIQANMDPNHRDRMAFMRLCSGRLTRGMKVKHVRTDKIMALTAPQFFFAQDRSLAEEAFAGDVVGIPNRGTLRIGDALTEGEDVQFLGIPSFAPEILRRIRLEDAIRAKKLKDALKEMAEEGVVQLFSPLDGTQPIVGVIGALQLDVLGDRLTHEYGLPIGFEHGAVRGAALDHGGRSGEADALHREQPLVHRQGFGRRLRLHGAVGVQLELGAGAQPGHQVHRRESRDAGLMPPLSAAVCVRTRVLVMFLASSEDAHGRGI